MICALHSKCILETCATSDVFGDFKGLNDTVNSQEEVTGTTPTWLDMVLVYIPPNERQNEIRTTTQVKVCRVSLRAVSTSDSRVAVTVHAQVRERYVTCTHQNPAYNFYSINAQ